MSLVVEDRKKQDLNIIPNMVFPGEMIINIDPKEFGYVKLGFYLQRREKCRR